MEKRIRAKALRNNATTPMPTTNEMEDYTTASKDSDDDKILGVRIMTIF
jgi:hypothetical protein